MHAVVKAQALVEWCQTYNSGKLVMQTLDQQACKDSTHHAEHYYFLESQRKAYRGVQHRGQHPKAWAILSATFPNWHLCEQSLCEYAGRILITGSHCPEVTGCPLCLSSDPSPSTFSSSSSVQAQRSFAMEPVGFNEEEGAINTLLAGKPDAHVHSPRIARGVGAGADDAWMGFPQCGCPRTAAAVATAGAVVWAGSGLALDICHHDDRRA